MFVCKTQHLYSWLCMSVLAYVHAYVWAYGHMYAHTCDMWSQRLMLGHSFSGFFLYFFEAEGLNLELAG